MNDLDGIAELKKALSKFDARIKELETIKGLNYKNFDELQIEIGARQKAVEILKKARDELYSAIS